MDDIVDELQTKTILIACTLRSGSNLLCEFIQKSGHSLPIEFFQEDKYQNHFTVRNDEYNFLPSAMDRLLAFNAERKPNVLHGVKWNWSQFRTLLKSIKSESLEDIVEFFPCPIWIRLSRRDKIAQTASLLLAQQTGVWVSGDPVLPSVDQAYDFERAWDIFCDLSAEESMWDSYFASCGLQPLTIYYEDILHKYEETAHIITQYLGENNKAQQAFPRLSEFRNKKIDNGLSIIYRNKLYDDILSYNYKSNALKSAIQIITKKVNEGATSDVFSRFAVPDQGNYGLICKINLRQNFQINGSHEWVRGSEFLDGEGLRLDQGATATLNVTAGRLLILFHAHSWSGVAEITENQGQKNVDLYSPWNATVPIMLHWDKTQDRNITISATGDKSNLSSGSEVWIQRVWRAQHSE